MIKSYKSINNKGKVYLYLRFLFYIMFDLVAYYSFISNKTATELNLKIYNSKEKWSFLSVQKKNFSLLNMISEYFNKKTANLSFVSYQGCRSFKYLLINIL